jgi:hypothetical protein
MLLLPWFQPWLLLLSLLLLLLLSLHFGIFGCSLPLGLCLCCCCNFTFNHTCPSTGAWTAMSLLHLPFDMLITPRISILSHLACCIDDLTIANVHEVVVALADLEQRKDTRCNCGA